MAGKPLMSRRELEVARILWRLKEATTREVFEAFPDKRVVDFTTVQTFLKRLHAKNYVRVRVEGRKAFYRPCVRPNTVIRGFVDDFTDWLFGGEPLLLIHHLIEDSSVSNEQLRELREKLDKLVTEQDESSKQ